MPVLQALKEDTKEFFNKLTNSPTEEEIKSTEEEDELSSLNEELFIKIKCADLGTEEYDGSTSYTRCYVSFENFMTWDGDVIYDSHDQFTEPTGEYYIKINDNHYEYIRREVKDEVDPGWVYNGTKSVTENKTLASWKKIEMWDALY